MGAAPIMSRIITIALLLAAAYASNESVENVVPETEYVQELTDPVPEADLAQVGGGGLKHAGKDCWSGCNHKQGKCSWCGTGGICCRKGWKDKSNGCDGKLGIAGKGHVCVPAPAGGLKNAGKDCWNGCNHKQGKCSWCGTGGICCRKGWKDKSNGCDGK